MQKVIQYRGVSLNQRTIDMIEAAEWVAGFKFHLTQGSYNAGGVAASAGTHDGGGAVDISLKDQNTGVLFPKVRRETIRNAARQVGFAAWIRDPSQSRTSWPWHTHCIAIGDPDLSGSAEKGTGAIGQVQDYKNGFNGLASGGKDDGPRTWVNVTWESWQKAHPNWKEPFTVGQYESLLQEIKTQGDATRQEVRRQAIWTLRYGVQTVDERAAANKAFDDAIKAGKPLADALLAASKVMQPLNTALGEAAKKNG